MNGKCNSIYDVYKLCAAEECDTHFSLSFYIVDQRFCYNFYLYFFFVFLKFIFKKIQKSKTFQKFNPKM